jgi:hypothetical protein
MEARQFQPRFTNRTVFSSISKGNLYICDIRNHRIRRVNLKSGIITTFAGTGERAPTPDGAKIAGTPLNGPRALDFDKQGNLWLALREGNAVYKMDLKRGKLHHVAGTGAQGFSGNGGPAKLATLSGPKGLSVGPEWKHLPHRHGKSQPAND